MLGGKNKQPLGYTIVEVMIVLAVSGIMFTIAANFINGKQERSSFTAGVNQMASEIQDVVEQVSDGKYSDIPLNCNYNNGSTIVNQGAKLQGTNSSCVFLGKVIRIPTSSMSLNTYSIFSIVGGKLDSIDQPSTQGPDAGDPSIVDPALTTKQAISQNLGLTIVGHAGWPQQSVTAYDPSGLGFPYHTTAFGFIQSQGVANAGNENTSFQTGAQTLSLVYVPRLLDTTPNTGINTNLNLTSKVDICLTDGTQTAKITVGTNNSQLSVNVTRLNAGVQCP